MKKLLLLVCALTLVLGVPEITSACMCDYVDAQDAFLSARLVFVGKVTNIVAGREAGVGLLMKESGALELLKQPRWEKSTDKVQIVTLEITEAFKGMTDKTINIVTAVYDHGATCGVNFKIDETYLVYAYERRRELTTEQTNLPKNEWTKEVKLKWQADKFNERLPAFGTSICSRTERMLWAKDDVDMIRRILKGEIVPRPRRPAHPIIR